MVISPCGDGTWVNNNGDIVAINVDSDFVKTTSGNVVIPEYCNELGWLIPTI